MDKDHDNRLGDNDFSQSVREDPVLLSCFGQVFPNARVIYTNFFFSSHVTLFFSFDFREKVNLKKLLNKCLNKLSLVKHLQKIN